MSDVRHSIGIDEVKSMVLEVLEANPEGVMLVPLFAEVDKQLVAQQIRLEGCNYDQVRYALRWLEDNEFVQTKPAQSQGNHYLYFVKCDAWKRKDPRHKRYRSKALPTTALTPMAFACHSLSLVPSTWDPEQEAKQERKAKRAPPVPPRTAWSIK